MQIKNTIRTVGEERVVWSSIARALRQAIVDGRLQPGQRLPTHTQLCVQFKTTPSTIQRAIAELSREEFICTADRSGRFVAEKPPHLNHYALVFWNDPADPQSSQSWSRYYIAFSEEARRLQTRGYRISSFYGVDHHSDSEGKQRLLNCIASQRLAGIIFVNNPFLIKESPIVNEPGIPRVAFTLGAGVPNAHSIAFDESSWVRKAAELLVAHRRRRPAVMLCDLSPAREQVIARILARHGLSVPHCWWQSVHPHAKGSAERCAELLMYGARKERPDALLIMDDNLVEESLAGLIKACVQVPDEVLVVGHANFPHPPSKTLAATWLGYDIHCAFLKAIELIDLERAGENAPSVTALPAVFESETLAAAESVTEQKPWSQTRTAKNGVLT